jgi:rare lipoprotein A
MKRLTILLFLVVGITMFSAAQIPGFEPFRQEGIASWHGRDFDGRATASGEIFDSALFTAAHPTLPFGTFLIVTNVQNNLQVIVRVNDRGPFTANRIIDLSMSAAGILGMLTTGPAHVVVERTMNTALGPVGVPAPIAPHFVPPPQPQAMVQQPPVAVAPAAPEPPPPAPHVFLPPQAIHPPELAPAPQVVPQFVPPPQQPAMVQQPPVEQPPVVTFAAPPAQMLGAIPSPGSTNLYRIQVGSYQVPRHAVEAFERLRNSGLSPAYERHVDFYRVVLPGVRADDVPAIAQTLGNLGFREVIVRQETGH